MIATINQRTLYGYNNYIINHSSFSFYWIVFIEQKINILKDDVGNHSSIIIRLEDICYSHAELLEKLLDESVKSKSTANNSEPLNSNIKV